MSKQTAVEWMVEQVELISNNKNVSKKEMIKLYDEVIEQAKKMERKQMTRVKVTYVAMDVDGYKPIMSADSFENLRAGLDDYYGCDNRGGECLGFTPYQTKYPDEYEGHYEYKVTMVHSDRDKNQRFILTK